MRQRESIYVINPANEEVIGEVPRGNADDADSAVRAAREAFRKWRWVPAIEKAVMLHKIAAGIRSKQQDLATLMTREGGCAPGRSSVRFGWKILCVPADTPLLTVQFIPCHLQIAD